MLFPRMLTTFKIASSTALPRALESQPHIWTSTQLVELAPEPGVAAGRGRRGGAEGEDGGRHCEIFLARAFQCEITRGSSLT